MAQIVTHLDTTRYAAFDSRWCAYDANHDLGQPIGKGATEAEAIEDLIRQMPDVADEDILTRGSAMIPQEIQAMIDAEAALDAADEAVERARIAACEYCKGTGRITIRTRSVVYVCAGDPPEYAQGVVGTRCAWCSR